ncbi:MAG: hypothetical protein KatS3mg066_2164 [Fischerella sp.]|nr:MAG: hypothetical protein KatS3mg066_2164 [Fischerella sp.]
MSKFARKLTLPSYQKYNYLLKVKQIFHHVYFYNKNLMLFLVPSFPDTM